MFWAEEYRKEQDRKRKEAVKVIDTAKSALQKAKGFNLAVSDAERLLNEAESLLGKGDYATAIERANKSKGIAEWKWIKSLNVCVKRR